MAQYKNLDPEDLLTCPYNESHVIRRKRMQCHLSNCRKNFPFMDMTQCPFNATHHIKSAELQYHIANCNDRVLIEQDIKYEQRRGMASDSLHGDLSVPQAGWSCPDGGEEDWDTEATNDESFNHSAHSEKESRAALGSSPTNSHERHTVPKVLTKNHRQFPGKDVEVLRKPRAVNAATNPAFNLSLINSRSGISVGRGFGRGSSPTKVVGNTKSFNGQICMGYGRGRGGIIVRD